jgi:hypothetical protein
MANSLIDQLGLIVDLFDKDQEPFIQKYCIRLRKAYRRIFGNPTAMNYLKEYDITYIFRFHVRHMEKLLKIGDDNFLENVYLMSHDATFQEDLIASFEDLYFRVINNARIGFWKKQKLLAEVRLSVTLRLILENRFEAFILITAIISVMTVFITNSVLFGFMGFVITLLVFMLVLYFIINQFGHYL